MYDLIKDLSNLTEVPEKYLNKLVENSFTILNNDMYESLLNKENQITVNIGIGTLVIIVNSEEIKYKFLPNTKLNECIKNASKEKYSELENNLNSSLVKNIVNTYKEFL